MADRLEMFGPTRGFSEMVDSMEPCKVNLWEIPFLSPANNNEDKPVG